MIFQNLLVTLCIQPSSSRSNMGYMMHVLGLFQRSCSIHCRMAVMTKPARGDYEGGCKPIYKQFRSLMDLQAEARIRYPMATQTSGSYILDQMPKPRQIPLHEAYLRGMIL